MKGNGHTLKAGWFPLENSYEEAVLTWYEQIETSFRRRRFDEERPAQAEQAARREAVGEAQPAVFD